MVHLVLTVTAMSVSLSVCTYFNSLLYFAGSLQFAAGRGGRSKGVFINIRVSHRGYRGPYTSRP